MPRDRTPAEAPKTVSGSRRTLTIRVRVLYSCVFLAYVSWAVVSRRVPSVFALLWLIVVGFSWFQPTTRVDRAGVRRPVLRRSRRLLPWADIAAVARPGRFDATTVLLLVDGRQLTLADIPAAKAAEVAALGGKPLVSTTPAADPAAAPGHRPVTASQERQDFERRVARLAADRAMLASELANCSPTDRGARGASGQ